MNTHPGGQSDPTVQPVPASVVAQVDAADTTLSNPAAPYSPSAATSATGWRPSREPWTRWRTPPDCG